MDQIDYQRQRKRIRDLRRDFSTRKLPRAFKDLELALFDHVGTATLECWPSQKRLADIVGISVRSIKRNLKAVEMLGLFTINKGTGGTSSHYKLRFDCPAWRKDKLELVAKVVSLYAAKGKGVGTRASLPRPAKVCESWGRIRLDSGDAGVLKGSDAVVTPASPKLPQGSARDAAECASLTQHQLEEEVNCPPAAPAWTTTARHSGLAASPLAGSLPAAPAPTPLNTPAFHMEVAEPDEKEPTVEELLLEIEKQEWS